MKKIIFLSFFVSSLCMAGRKPAATGDYICERVVLGDLELNMNRDCDKSKPFSLTNAGKEAVYDTYLYCCVKK